MSGSLPASPVARTVRLTSQTPNIITYSVNGRRQVKSGAGHYWTLEFDYAPTKTATFLPLQAFIVKQSGQFETFTATIPDHSNTITEYSGADPVINGALSIGVTTANFDGASTGTAILKAGDFIKFSGHGKVYMVTADVTSTGSGTGSIQFFPALLASVANDETVTVNSVPFTLFLEDNNADFNLGMADTAGFSFSAREAI